MLDDYGPFKVISCSATTPATDSQVAAGVSDLLGRRAAMNNPPVTLTVSDAVARGIAALFTSGTPSGQVLERFYRSGRADSAELLETARNEQGFASPDGHAALHCLIGWVHSRLHRQTRQPASR